MAKTIKTKPGPGEKPLQPGDDSASADLGSALSTKSIYSRFDSWIVGLSPLIVHAWSHKAKLQMLIGQSKAVRGKGKEPRNPRQDFTDSLYKMGVDKKGNDIYGFPVTGIKKALLGAAHKDKGVAKTAALSNLWVDGKLVRVPTAHKDAICDIPLVRLYGSKPEMREDMVRIGSGIQKTANLAYRAQFDRWAVRLRGRYNAGVITPTALATLLEDSGHATGIGEWRNEKNGVFGAFRLADAEEAAAWTAFSEGRGPLPEIESDELLERVAAE